MRQASRISAVVFERWWLNYAFSLCCSLLPLRNIEPTVWITAIFLTPPVGFCDAFRLFFLQKGKCACGEWGPIRYSPSTCLLQVKLLLLIKLAIENYSVNICTRRQTEGYNIQAKQQSCIVTSYLLHMLLFPFSFSFFFCFVPDPDLCFSLFRNIGLNLGCKNKKNKMIHHKRPWKASLSAHLKSCPSDCWGCILPFIFPLYTE